MNPAFDYIEQNMIAPTEARMPKMREKRPAKEELAMLHAAISDAIDAANHPKASDRARMFIAVLSGTLEVRYGKEYGDRLFSVLGHDSEGGAA